MTALLHTTAWRSFPELGAWYRLDEGSLLGLPHELEGEDDPALRELAGESFEVDWERLDEESRSRLPLIREHLEACALLELWLSSVDETYRDRIETTILAARTIVLLEGGRKR